MAASAVIRRNDDILLVHQQGPEDSHPSWGLPGGMVEAGEDAQEALIREIHEETGLTVSAPVALLGVVQIHTREHGLLSAFYFEFEAPDGIPQPRDPDGIVLHAAWVPLAEAITNLGTLRHVHMREPAIAYVQGMAPTYWTWRDNIPTTV
ncbi:NUDIX domain-containing protein [Nonomuraea sp. NBC_01738]|nr:NUDIX domain-containing protein [Nonomuraea sp. NBC_01738]